MKKDFKKSICDMVANVVTDLYDKVYDLYEETERRMKDIVDKKNPVGTAGGEEKTESELDDEPKVRVVNITMEPGDTIVDMMAKIGKALVSKPEYISGVNITVKDDASDEESEKPCDCDEPEGDSLGGEPDEYISFDFNTLDENICCGKCAPDCDKPVIGDKPTTKSVAEILSDELDNYVRSLRTEDDIVEAVVKYIYDCVTDKVNRNYTFHYVSKDGNSSVEVNIPSNIASRDELCNSYIRDKIAKDLISLTKVQDVILMSKNGNSASAYLVLKKG